MDIRVRRMIGGGIWGVGFVVAIVWGAVASSGIEGRGYGFAPPMEVAALETGRVGDVMVELHQRVGPADVLVHMDTKPLELEREWVNAQYFAVQQVVASDAAVDQRRAAGAQYNRAKLVTQLQADRASLAALKERLAVEEGLASSGASSGQAVAEWNRQIRVVRARVAAGSSALAGITDTPSTGGAPADPDAPLDSEESWEVVAASRELDVIQGRIDAMSLTAGIDGQVTWIYRTEGEVVAAGEPVLQVRRMGTRDVVAFVHPAQASQLTQGDAASVRRATGEVLSGRLVSVGSGPQPLPQRIWHNPAYPEYAVPVRIELENEIGPDEPVSVSL